MREGVKDPRFEWKSSKKCSARPRRRWICNTKLDITENVLMMKGELNWVRHKKKIKLSLKVQQNVYSYRQNTTTV